MTRRLAALALSAVVVLGASACSTVDPPALTVGGYELSARDLRTDLKALAEAGVPFGPGVDARGLLPSAVPADYTRAWLTLQAQYELFHQVAGEAGLVPTQADVDAEAERLQAVMQQGAADGGDPWAALPERLRNYLATRGAEANAVTSAPNADELRVKAVDLAGRVSVDPRHGRWSLDSFEVVDPSVG